MKNLKFLKSTLQVLIAMYPFCSTIFTNNPEFNTMEFAFSLIGTISIEISYRLVSYTLQQFLRL